MGASPRETKALVEAMGVESNYQHLNYGDRDSVGVLQQRPSQGWGPAGESIEKDVSQFLRAARKANGGGSAGQLAQAVQRSAFPERYDQRSGEADALIQKYGSSSPSTNPRSEPRYRTRTTPGVDRSAERQQLKLDYLAQRGRPGALLGLKAGLDAAQDTPSRTVRERIQGDSSSEPSNGVRGASTRSYGGTLNELFYNGPGGVNVGEDKRVGKGFVSGHTDHVHVATGPKNIRRLAKLAQDMGLTVRELEPFDKVDPVHTNGSFHYSGRAADISGDPKKMAEFSRRVARLYRV